MPRFYCPQALHGVQTLALPAGAARHVQVLRMQPGDGLALFDGTGGEYAATVLRMGRSEVIVHVDKHHPIERETRHAMHLAVSMPANERMDWLVEKAAELGAASIQPLCSERCVVQLKGERAMRKQSHWQAVAIAACEQCGRNRVATIHPVQSLAHWLGQLALPMPSEGQAPCRIMLSLREASRPLTEFAATASPIVLLLGPEGGLTPQEENAAIAQGFACASLGNRVLRAETAALAALAITSALA